MKIADIRDSIDFKVKGNKTLIRYCFEDFILIDNKILGDLIIDFLSPSLAERIVNKFKNVLTNQLPSQLVIDGEFMMKCFYTLKSEFQNRQVKYKIDHASKEFTSFLKAVKICYELKEKNFNHYIQAQIHGFGYLKQFPPLGALHTNLAIERYHSYQTFLHKTKLEKINKNKEFKRLFITDEEKELTLTTNERYIKFFNNIKDETATMQQAVYCRDFMILRRGRVMDKRISDYISKLRNEVNV